MTSQKMSGIIIVVEFDWPEEITPEMFQASANLHKVITESDWITEKVAAYGGLRTVGGFQCIWIFQVETFGDLDKLFERTVDNTFTHPEAEAYSNFFSKMQRVEERIRYPVMFG